jgi:hypothetical protein
MDTKAAFEKWYLEQQDPEAYLASDESGYFDDTVQMEWGIWRQAWEASRAAIEIELKDAHLDAGKGKIVLSLTSVLNEMASHGIRIKGKTE